MTHRGSLLVVSSSLLLLAGCQQLQALSAAATARVPPATQFPLAGQVPPTAERLAEMYGIPVYVHQPQLDRDPLMEQFRFAVTAAAILTGDVTTAFDAVQEHQLVLHAPADPASPLQPISGWELQAEGDESLSMTIPSETGRPSPTKVAVCSIGDNSMPAGFGPRLHPVLLEHQPEGDAALPSKVTWVRQWALSRSVGTLFGLFGRTHERLPLSWEEALIASRQAPVGYTWQPATSPQLPDPLPNGVSLAIHPERNLFGLFASGDVPLFHVMEVDWSSENARSVPGTRSVPMERSIPASEWVWWGTMQFPE
ncbi:MAG: hypothetical protein GEEBNDBF_01469 [bacterium]|nr:hypothetical protein [bacterium]